MANGYNTSSSSQNLNKSLSTSDDNIKKITNLQIDTSEMPTAVTSRKFLINGDIEAQFTLRVLQNDTLKYYDFSSKSFALGHNSNVNDLKVTMKSNVYFNEVIFPSGGGTYTIKLITSIGTETVGYKTKNVISKAISKQSSDSTITFQAASLAKPDNYQTTPTTTSTGALAGTGNVNFDWTITNASTDAGGFGLILKGDYKELDEKVFYIKTTTDVVSQPAGEAEVTVDSLTDIVVGSYLWSGTGLSGTPRITAIDTENKILTLDSVQTINDAVTLTVKTYGIEPIRDAIGVTLAFTPVTGGAGNSPRIIATALTKTVRANVSSSTSVTLTDTQGVAGGNIVTYTGVGVNNSSSNRVTSVTPDCPDLASAGALDNDGVVVVELAQTLEAGTELRFEGSLKTLRILGGISVNGYPSANKTIYFDLDEPLSVGTAS